MYYTVIYKRYAAENAAEDLCFEHYDDLCRYVFYALRGYAEHAGYGGGPKLIAKPGLIQIRATKPGCYFLTEVILALCVYTAKNKSLDVQVLYKKGRELVYGKNFYIFGYDLKGYSFREGPVPGVHKRSKGSYFRKVKTQQELAQVAAVQADEGEPKWRAKRKNIPNSWDDVLIRKQRSWKAQHKGKKAWDN